MLFVACFCLASPSLSVSRTVAFVLRSFGLAVCRFFVNGRCAVCSCSRGLCFMGFRFLLTSFTQKRTDPITTNTPCRCTVMCAIRDLLLFRVLAEWCFRCGSTFSAFSVLFLTAYLSLAFRYFANSTTWSKLYFPVLHRFPVRFARDKLGPKTHAVFPRKST